MFSPGPCFPVYPGAQGLTAGQKHFREPGTGNRHDRKRSPQAQAPTPVSPKQILLLGQNKFPSPRTGVFRAPQDSSYPRQRDTEVSWQEGWLLGPRGSR